MFNFLHSLASICTRSPHISITFIHPCDTRASAAFGVSKWPLHTSVSEQGEILPTFPSGSENPRGMKKYNYSMFSPSISLICHFTIKVYANCCLSYQAYFSSRVPNPSRKLRLPLSFHMKMPASLSSACATVGSGSKYGLPLPTVELSKTSHQVHCWRSSSQSETIPNHFKVQRKV